jgi:hypothetical protein
VSSQALKEKKDLIFLYQGLSLSSLFSPLSSYESLIPDTWPEEDKGSIMRSQAEGGSFPKQDLFQKEIFPHNDFMSRSDHNVLKNFSVARWRWSVVLPSCCQGGAGVYMTS